MSVQAIKAGAEDFLTKPVSKAILFNAIDRAMRTYSAARVRHLLLNPLRLGIGKLTPREKEVYELVVRGRMNKQVAYELGMTERTVKAHERKFMEKTRARTLPTQHTEQ